MIVAASAPGKVILFGEHAVVHGVTAIAAALSDLRIFAIVESSNESEIAITMHDIKVENGEPFSIKYPTSVTEALSSDRYSDTYNPTPEILEKLKSIVQVSIDAASQGIMASLYLISNILHDYFSLQHNNDSTHIGLNIEIKSIGLPIGAGLGSSAAFSVALSSALIRFYQLYFHKSYPIETFITATTNTDTTSTSCTNSDKSNVISAIVDSWKYDIKSLNSSTSKALTYIHPISDELTVINKWAYAAEVVIHGTPSGLDNTTSCYGGALKFSRKPENPGFERLHTLPEMNILLTNTKVPRKTSLLVAKVGEYYKHYPKIVQPLFDSIEAISTEFLQLCTSTEEKEAIEHKIGTLMNMNQGILTAIGVSHPSLSIITDMAKSYHMYSKLTGAGGGGCAITLIPAAFYKSEENNFSSDGSADSESYSPLNSLITALSSHGYESQLSGLGGVGVKWHV